MATVAQPARAPHPATVAQPKPSAAGPAGGPRPPAGPPQPHSPGRASVRSFPRASDGRTVQRYTGSPYVMDGFNDRTSDRGGIVLWDKKTLYARAELIESANMALDAVNGGRGSYVQLVPTGAVYGDDPDLLQVTVRMRPGRHQLTKASTYHRDLAILNAQDTSKHVSHADCHLNSQTVMGSDDHPLGLDDSEQVVIKAPDNSMRLLPPVNKTAYKGNSDAGANRAMYATLLYAVPEFAAILEDLAKNESNERKRARYLGLKESIDQLHGRTLDKEVMSKYAAIYRAIYDHWYLSRLFAETFAVNQYASPYVGEALTQVNDEGEKIAADRGGEVDLWNFHWAGVILRDGTDYVTLENLSTEFLSHKNDKWYFAMYGAGGQSFHAQASRDSHVGAHPITMRIRMVPVVRSTKAAKSGPSKLQQMMEKNKLL
ncbi:hypothetical protein [Polyangium sorediatum]|uniref:Uncharacterized protein n=1 Tax=Polyangium sorediatum TaxID=889274 RepID=A0ABT6NS59_9BACT|nr:hypothetical protein [Polyangium sorediatum]MDI1431167.1 hypothetical protein [Polyangium sorediatum]